MSKIEVKSLCKTFEQDGIVVEALKDINLNIETGDIYGIIGMSGAGKSTLVRCLNFLEVPTSGDVIVSGEALSTLSEAELRKKRTNIGMIFQDFNLLMQKSIMDNVIFPLKLQGVNKKEALERGRELLEIVGLTEKASAYPAMLSGGQRQRVAIARALATNPEILLCDEATSALDPQTTSSILSLLKEINEKYKITIVIITHQMSVVQEICNKVAIISGGRLVEEGYVEKIFDNPKSDAAKELIFGKLSAIEGRDFEPVSEIKTGKIVRIVFNENSSYEPVVANMILNFQTQINILKADTRDVSGKAKGDMIIQLPDDEYLQVDMIKYLQERGLTVTEVKDHVG